MKVHVFHGDLNPPDQIEALPVVEREAVATGYAQQVPSEYPLCSELWFERLLLFEVFEYLHTRGTLTDSIPETTQQLLLAHK